MEKFPLPEKYAKEEKFLNALAEAYRLQEAIINTTELCIISLSPDGIVTSFNQAAELMLGYAAEDMISRTAIVNIHDKEELNARSKELTRELLLDVKPGFESLVTKARHTRTADRKEWTYIRKNNERIPVLLSVTSLWDDKENLLGYACIATDITVLKRAEAKIRKSEAHLQALVTSLDDVVIEIDKNGTYINQWTSLEDDIEQKNKNINDVFGKDLGIKFLAIIKRVIATHKTEFLEYQSHNNNTQWRNAKFSYLQADRVLVCIRNITAKKQAELELKKSESKFRILAENIPGVIYLCNNDARYSMLYLNHKVEELTGYHDHEFIAGNINFVQLYHPDDVAGIFEKVDKALADKKSFQLTYRLKHRSGEWRWVEEMGTGVYQNETLLLIEGFIIDITNQKLAEERLQKVAEENYRLFNNAVNLTAIAGFDGYFKRVNQSWSKLLGWSEEEILARPFIDFVHPDDVDSTKNASRHISRGNNLETFENRYRCKDGSYRWLLWASASDAPRQLIYATAVDITERKKSEEETLRSKQNLEIAAENLMEQNRLLDEFAHIISHNLRSPIGNIQALIALLNKYSSIEDYSMVFDKLNNLAKNLSETMNELMDTLKVKTNTDIQKAEIRFKDLLDKVIQSLEGEMMHVGATITYNFNAAPKVLFAKAYLESVFQNLLTNAIKYRSPNRAPEIHIESLVQNGRVQLRVRDNGLGIDLERYGDKLFGLHKTFHEHKEAKGVGLFLTKTQIEALNGTIGVESEVDKGTTFIITF
jgi:PAS domain S-box-containing protein